MELRACSWEHEGGGGDGSDFNEDVVFRCRDIKERTDNVTAASPAMRALGECLRLAHGGGSCGALGVTIDQLRAAALSLRGMKLLATLPKCISVTASGACKEWGGNKETEYQVCACAHLAGYQNARAPRSYCSHPSEQTRGEARRVKTQAQCR